MLGLVVGDYRSLYRMNQNEKPATHTLIYKMQMVGHYKKTELGS